MKAHLEPLPTGARMDHRSYRIEQSDSEESWLTHMLVASFGVYSIQVGASSQSESQNALIVAGFEENQFPVKVDGEKGTVSVHGTQDDIRHAAQLMNIRGFKEDINNN